MAKALVSDKTKKKKEKTPGVNQFGKRMALAIPTLVQGWICTECNAVSFGNNGKVPTRCSNRKTCGRLFHGIKRRDLASGQDG